MTTEKIDTIQKALDCAIRDAENMTEQGGYDNGKKVYPNYMHKDAWKRYLQEIPDDIKKRIKKELAGNPPHMASFGSSCRMAYNRLKKVKNIVFEYGLPTEVGGTAQLDAYIQDKKFEIFVEAKCREIYKEHYGDKAYKEVYKFLREWDKKFDFDAEKRTFSYDGEEVVHFDLKQLICHFLGITAGLLNGTITAEKVRFVYLIYNPNDVKEFIADDKYRDEILEQYQATLDEIDLFDMKELFKTIYEFQKENLKIKRNIKEGFIVESCFEFKLVDQNHLNGLFD